MGEREAGGGKKGRTTAHSSTAWVGEGGGAEASSTSGIAT